VERSESLQKPFRNWARGLGSGSTALLVQDKFHGLALGNWRMVTWAVLLVSLTVLIATEDVLRRHRPTLHFGHHEGHRAVWVEPPNQPLFGTRRREVEVGRRAIAVGNRVLAELAKAKTHMATVGHDDMDRYMAEYQRGLDELKASVGGAWHEVLMDLERCGVLPNPRYYYELSVNYTALDRDVLEIQATARQLIRRHGKDPE
jgi:hypothetical protein